MSKKICLTTGQQTTVDDIDYDWLMQWEWFAKDFGDGLQVVRWSKPDVFGKRRLIHMDEEILLRSMGKD